MSVTTAVSGVAESVAVDSIFSVAGVRLSAVAAGIRYADRLDLVLIELAETSEVAGMFTRNAFCAAPVVVCRDHLQEAASRYLLVNTGNANAGMGASGLAAARTCCEKLAALVACPVNQVLPFSTGVIGEPLPTERVVAALPAAISGLHSDNWEAAARGIMTTDTRPKLASRRLTLTGRAVTVTGIAKGAGMIKPDMATMLAFVFTDLGVGRERLQSLLAGAVQGSFNRITVDGDTSTNDSCMLAATGASGMRLEDLDPEQSREFEFALMAVFTQLAQDLIRDAEGATKFVTVRVTGGASSAECLRVAYLIAESPLVKTALFASDPNWGRLLAAVGRAGLEALDLDRVTIDLGTTRIVTRGSRDPDYREAAGQAVMAERDIALHIDLGRGEVAETVWTSDLSHEYIRINAEYRT